MVNTSPAHPLFFDERSEPDFRNVFGRLLHRATTVDVALHRIRLSALDFGERELAGLTRLRLLLRELNAVTLDAEAHSLLTDRSRSGPLLRLSRLLEEEVIEVRASPLGGWSPNFSVFADESGPQAVLLGAHWFQRPFPHQGPAFASLHGAEDAALAAARFETAWEHAHEVRPAVRNILQRAGALQDRSDPGRDGTP